jgi:non-ribosomal peptide synthetase component F
VEHRSLTNFHYWIQKQFNFTANDVMFSTIQFSFDPHALDIWQPLSSGATLIISKEVRDI